MDLRSCWRNANCFGKICDIWVILYLLKQESLCQTIKKWVKGYSKFKTVKGCRSFAGMVNFLSIFYSELQKLLKPIYNLSKKGTQFVWGEEQQLAFEEIKCRFIKLPLLHLPDNKGWFHLYSDSCKFASGSVLYQIQNGKPKLIAYTSKRLLKAGRNYFLTELEMCRLAITLLVLCVY